MIRTENLTKRYRRNEALHSLTLQVPEGSVFALVGPNGAGKSTARNYSWDVNAVPARANQPEPRIALREAVPDEQLRRSAGGGRERVKDAHIDLIGSAALQFYRLGQTTTMPTNASRDVPDVGKCTPSLVEDRFSESMFKVFCESPHDLPTARVRLTHAQSGREWKAGLNSSITYSPGPHQTWFSPLKRGQTFFRLSDRIPTHPGDQWVVPFEYVPSAEVHITPEIPTGFSLARFRFQNLTLTNYLLQ